MGHVLISRGKMVMIKARFGCEGPWASAKGKLEALDTIDHIISWKSSQVKISLDGAKMEELHCMDNGLVAWLATLCDDHCSSSFVSYLSLEKTSPWGPPR